MLHPINCPVCGKSSVEPVLQRVIVIARYEAFQGDVGGLRVYRCKELGHIFFVRLADLGERETARTLAS